MALIIIEEEKMVLSIEERKERMNRERPKRRSTSLSEKKRPSTPRITQERKSVQPTKKGAPGNSITKELFFIGGKKESLQGKSGISKAVRCLEREVAKKKDRRVGLRAGWQRSGLGKKG